MKKYDVIVIGSGAGAKITRPAANLGYKVAIIEKGRLGGTCLNHGCIPSKMLIHPADLLAELEEAPRFNIKISKERDIDFEKLVTEVTQTIDKESNSIPGVYESHPNIDLYQTEAFFETDKIINVNGERITAEKIFIAAGVRAHIPEIKGLKNTPFMTYKEALRNTKKPKSMLILGGGFIAVELGYFYKMMGVDVQFIVRSNLLNGQDKEIQDVFTQSFTKRCKVALGTQTEEVEYKNGLFTLHCKEKSGEKKKYEAESLLIATGITPNTDLLKLQNTSIKQTQKGFIEVDNTLQTSVEGIWAFGDIIGRHLFRHSANFEGEYVFKTVFEDKDTLFPEEIKYPPMPQAVFSNPQIGSVGPTEEELKTNNIPYIVGKNEYKSSAMGMALRSEEGFCKLLFHKDTKKLLAAHIIGKEASNMVHMCIAFMVMNATLDDMLKTIYIHPALPEIVRNAARKAS